MQIVMNIHSKILLGLMSALALSSCDDGDIKTSSAVTLKDGYVVKVTGALANASSWSELGKSYTLVVAGFAEGDSFPTISKIIPPASESIDITLSGMENSVSTVELCAINSIYKRVVSYDTIFSFQDNPDWDPRDTIFYEADGRDVGVYSGIYSKLFAGKGKCFRCHGEGSAAADMHLVGKENSYAELVGVDAKTVSGSKRVVAGDADNSVLYRVATEAKTDGALPWHYDHVSNVDGLDYNNQKLLRDWINAGAKMN